MTNSKSSEALPQSREKKPNLISRRGNMDELDLLSIIITTDAVLKNKVVKKIKQFLDKNPQKSSEK